MRAFRLEAHDAAPQLTDIAGPDSGPDTGTDPGPGMARVRIAACGLNFADLLMLKGQYQDTPALPFTMGMEVSGIVEAVGPLRDDLPPNDPDAELAGSHRATITPGTRVAVFAGHGGLADYGVFPVDRMTVLPDQVSLIDAAAFQIAYGTAHLALDHRARLRAGETLLVTGAAGGVGLTGVELGHLMGARVIACARGADKLALAQAAGASDLVDADTPDLRAAFAALGGADVVYDAVGGAQWQAAFRTARPEARLIPIGFASGEVPQIAANHLLVKNLTVIGLYWGGYQRFRPAVLRDSLTTLAGWIAAGRLRVPVGHVLPLDRTAEGLDLLRSRSATGKVVIAVDPELAHQS